MQVTLCDLKRVCKGSTHNAFGDLIEFNNRLLICYRQGQHHMSHDGIIVIVEVTADGQPLRSTRLTSPDGDLRDPHFCVDGNRLFLLAHQRWNAQLQKAKTYSWFSDNGISWSSRHDPGPDNWWLWRATAYKSQHWGLSYYREAERLDLYCGNLRSKMFKVATGVLSKTKHGAGYPNETDCFMTGTGELLALARRDADTFSAQLGMSKPPYQRWQWNDLNIYIGAPALLPVDGGKVLVAGRRFTGKKMVTQLWVLSLTDLSLRELITLPSAGDNSYPGLCIHNDHLYVAYYSSHIDNQSRMYLAKLTYEI